MNDPYPVNIEKKKPLISLLHPSRGRPEKSFQNAKEWIQKAGCDVELIVSIDSSDPMSTDYALWYTPFSNQAVTITLGHNYSGENYKMIQNINDSVVQATNRAAKEATGDILVYLSDDFKCFDNWGLSVIKELEGEDRPLLIKVDDCLQQFTVPVLTIPIMNRQLYDKLGYFWHPEYKSMFCDEHLYWISRKLGAMKMCAHLKFPHEHPANGKAPDDETYRRSAANWEQGKKLFKLHQSQGFPL